MGKKVLGVFGGLLMALFLLSAEAGAGAEETEMVDPGGLYLGADLIIAFPGADLRGDFAEVDPGAGWGVKIGYHFPIRLAVEAELGLTGHQVEGEDAGNGFFVVGLRYFPVRLSFSDRPLYPYFRLGLGRYVLVIENVQDGFGRREDLKLTGRGFDAGIGFDFYLEKNVSLEAGLTQRFVKYDDIDFLDSELSKKVRGHMTSLSGGVKYHF